MEFWLWRNLSFKQIEKHLFTDGTVPAPPDQHLRFAIVSYTFSGVIAPGGPQRRGRMHYMP